ncbi:aldo/keto reductase [Abditibacterium utsteinense]|nr:aldo/keto reductase [Abditibacterium utsteinense]
MIEKLTFGRTDHLSTRTLFGAAALSNVTQKEADETLQTLLQYGVNHIDTAASYGAAEERIGPWMASHRKDFFLATKTEKRTKSEAKEQIHRSLERLRVSQVDLLQLHSLGELADWETAMGAGGALEAAVEARDEGLVRFIGVTGHGLNIARHHLKALERFDFDSVLLPWNFPMSQNAAYAQEFAQLKTICQERNVAVQTIKAVTRRPWNETDTRNAATWYQPLEAQGDIDSAVAWLLGQPGIFLNTIGDIHILPRVLEAASRLENQAQQPSDETMLAMIEEREMAPLFV